MLDFKQEDSENLPHVASSDSGVLDLSCRTPVRSLEAVDAPTPSRSPLIPSEEMDKQQAMMQQANINAAFVPTNFNKGINTRMKGTFKDLLELSQKKKMDDSRINYNQNNNEATNANEMLYKQFKIGQINNNYPILNQTNATEIIGDTMNHSNLPLSIETILQSHSMSQSTPMYPPQYSPTSDTSVSTTPSLLPAVKSPEIDKSAVILESIKKAQRPFKVYPKDPLALSVGNVDTFDIYNKYRKVILNKVKHTETEGLNSKMRRNSNRSGSPTSTIKDDEKNRAYLERRKKNNAAAKRSRDARRAKEDEIAIRAAYLQQQNIALMHTIQSFMKHCHMENIRFDFESVMRLQFGRVGLDFETGWRQLGSC